jgi:hypothetical protein
MLIHFPYEGSNTVATSDSIENLVAHARKLNTESGDSYDVEIAVEGQEEYLQEGEVCSYDTYQIFKVEHV